MSQVAPQKPLRAERRLVKATGSTSLRSGRLQQTTRGRNRDLLEVGATVGDCVVPVSAWLVVRAAKAGDGSTCSHVNQDAPVHGAGANPRLTGRALTHRARGIDRDRSPTPLRLVVAFTLACPSSANSSPRRAGVSECWKRAESSRSASNTRLTVRLIASTSPSSVRVCSLHQQITNRLFVVSPPFSFVAVLVFEYSTPRNAG